MKLTICFTDPFGPLLHNKTKTTDFKIRNLIQLGWSLNPKTWAEFVHLFFFPFFFSSNLTMCPTQVSPNSIGTSDIQGGLI